MTALEGMNGTVCDAEQYQQSLLSFDSRNPSISCLTHGEVVGLVLTAETSTLSCICVVIIFIWIGRNVYWYKKKFPNGKRKLFEGPADIYMFSLFVFDLLQAIDGILNARWAHNGIVTTGPFCTAQGIISQFGEVGVALITLLLTVHTFIAAVWEVGLKARGIAFGLVCLTCVFLVLWVAIGPDIHKHYETPTPYWCWISPKFPGERLGGEYIWLWIALFASAILNIPLYFWAEGFWSVENGYNFYRVDPDKRVRYPKRRAVLGMLLYPAAYSIVVLPLTIARWLLFSGHHVSSAGTFFAISIFYLSGAINVVLFVFTRPELLLLHRPKKRDEKEIQLTSQGTAPQGTGPEMFSDTAKFQHSPEPTSAALGVEAVVEGSTDSPTPPHTNSRRLSDDI